MRYLLLVLLVCPGLSAVSQENLRFRASVDGAVGFGQNINSNAQTVGNGMVNLTLGVAKKGFSLGVGSGIFKMQGTKQHDYYVPIYGEFAYLVQNNKFAPFFGMKIGKLIPQKQPGADPVLNKSTMLYDPSIGLTIDLKVIYIMPFFEYLVPADFNSHYDTFGAGLRILTH